MEAASNSKFPSSLRAITNSRRRRVAPENRKRVATACNSCSLRRIKCSGERPCAQCARSSRVCEYPEGIDKVTVPRAELEALQERCSDLERQLRSSVSATSVGPDPTPSSAAASRQNAQLDSSSSRPSLPAPSSTLGAPSPTSQAACQSATVDVTPTEGRLLHDPDGTARYFGESSGANFLNHVKEFISTIQPLVTDYDGSQPGRTFLGSLGSYQTYDSRPLQIHSVDPMWLPSRTSMTVLLTELRYFAQDGNGDFPSGGIFYWGDLPSSPPDPQQAVELHSTGQLALLHIVFAVAVKLGATADWRDEYPSETFFSRARILLGNPLDITTYSSREISVLLLMALYYIEMNRRDAAYMTASMALHLAVMFGAHIRCGQDESSKRVFWTLYIIDCWLTCWLGRPPSISDQSIRIDLPEYSPGLPSPIGLRAHIELSRISRYIVCNVYRIAPWDKSSTTTLQHVEHALELLHAWLSSLPPELRLDYERPSHDRAARSLHLTYNQHIILTTRPIFFAAVKKAVADRYLPTPAKPQDGHDKFQYAMIRECSNTARQNLFLGRLVRELSPRQRLLHQEAHAIFNAAVIVLLHQLGVFGGGDSKDVSDVRFAIDVFEQEAALGNNFGVDCSRVLQDLQSLVYGLRERHDGPLTGPSIPSVEGQLNLGRMQSLQNTLARELPDMPTAMGGNITLQRELEAWLDNNYFQLYSDYMV